MDQDWSIEDNGDSVDSSSAGLRCHDVHSAFGNVDPNSALIAPLANTRIVGMAASLASTIRGQDVIADAESLKSIVAEQLDISPFAFPKVIETLETAEMIVVKRVGDRVVSFTESVPYHQDLYQKLGDAWSTAQPSQLELETVALVDRLASSPIPAETAADALSIDASDLPRLMEIGQASSLVMTVDSPNGTILYSPYFGFENPSLLAELFEHHGSGRVAEELSAVKKYQGLPIDENRHPALAEAVSRGLILAPSVRRPDSVEQAFAMLPYFPDPAMLTTKKSVVEKCLAVVACVRTGQHFGGSTPTRNPAAVLSALLDQGRDYTLGAHSSHKRQYQLLYKLQIVDFIPSGNWVQPKLIATEDNVEAVGLARDLLVYGESFADRTPERDAKNMLTMKDPYYAPIHTVGRRRLRPLLSERDYYEVLETAMGRGIR